MTLEQPRLDLIFFRLYRHLEVEATEREAPDIFLVRRFPLIAQDKYLFSMLLPIGTIGMANASAFSS